MRFYRCKVCGRKVCANNFQDRQPRPWRAKGVVVCVHCTPEAAELYLIVKGLADLYQNGHQDAKSRRKELMRRAWDRIHG